MDPWSLTTALAAVEPDIWSTTPFAAVGSVRVADDGRVRFEVRTRLSAAANLVDAAALPPVLRPAHNAGISVARLAAERDTERGVDRLLAAFRLDSIVRIPVGTVDAPVTVFAALDDSRAIDDRDIDAVERIAHRAVALAAGGEPRAVRERRLARFDALSGVLRTLAAALDIRDVFDQLSTLTRGIIPHESSVVGVFEDDGGRVFRLHAISAPTGWTMPPVMRSQYPDALTHAWEFALHHDLPRHPLEHDRPIAKLGIQSAIRMPLYVGGVVRGILVFNARAPHSYTQDDVIVAKRVADYVALALSHQQLAEQAREAAAVHTRAANLEMLDGLLKTLADALDPREVFDRISQIAGKVMTHDAMSISRPSADGQRVTILVTTGDTGGLQTPFEIPNPAPGLRGRPWEFAIVDDLSADPGFAATPAALRGMASLLTMPLALEGRFPAAVNFFSRTKGHFTRDDVLVGRRIADHIALALSHQRLVEEERRAIELRARAANLELLDQLLASMTSTTDLRELFDRVSVLTKKVIAHDALAMVVMLPDGVHARRYASAGLDLTGRSEIISVPESFIRDPDWDHDLVEDASARSEPINREMASIGFRSVLRVPIRSEGRLAAGIAFLARDPGVYVPADVLAARRVADRFALCLSRQRQAEASKRADEASERAARLEARVRTLTDELDARTGYRRVIGQSAPWTQALTQATQVAATDTTVLLLGESGTGKEVIARFLHRASTRGAAPFVALNCAALPEQLLEAELFGYERGAFTGATQNKPGQLEQAGGGTLFLDEVGEMSLPAQAKFLRVLQEREFQRLGGTRVLKTNARIVAATNRDLAQMIAQGAFREDLFYRLNVFAIRLPALRDRADDVLPLAEAFLAEYGGSLGRPPAGISRQARDTLRGYHWPGNVRELRNVLERAAILCEGGLITSEHLAIAAVPPPRDPIAAPVGDGAILVVDARQPPSPPAARPASAGDLQSMERALVEQALQHARFNKSKAAKSLGLTRAQLYVRMRRYGLE